MRISRQSNDRRSAKHRKQRRRLQLQFLEHRQLLAGDVMQNIELPEDVNNDGNVSAVDALMVINGLQDNNAPVELENGDRPETRQRFRDVNGDGQVTSNDALRIINRMARDRGTPNNGGPGQPQGPPTQEPDTAVDEVRSIDGVGNNLDDPTLGSAGIEFTRIVGADYADGISEPSGADLASARAISNAVFDQDESILNDRGLSDIVWQWGQFIDHDITLTGEAHEAESFNISVPLGDESFDPFFTGQAEIALTRSGVAEDTGVDSARQQTNEITAFIDGSMVYGSDEATAASLRSFEGGLLLTSENDLLPIGADGFFDAGDVRANEQHGLTAMHTLFVREHNRLASEIAGENPDLSDEEIYQEARAVVIGEIQAITYNEFLPALLGRGAVADYQGYDASVDPSISNLFATAAYRIGHSALSSELQRLDDDGNVIDEGNILLRDAFFNPTDVIELGIDPLLKGLATNQSQEFDAQLIDDVRNFLFGPPGAGGFDLAALNIQRGRDHGLPSYNAAREQLGLDPAESFADISSDPDVQARLAIAYESVDDVEVWVGALAEDHVRGGSLGEVATTVIADQFEAIRDGDRFWYENVFNGRELRDIDSTRLSDVIERNTELTSIQDNAFFVPDAQRNDRPDGTPGAPDAGGRPDGNNPRPGGGEQPDQAPPTNGGPGDNNGPDQGPGDGVDGGQPPLPPPQPGDGRDGPADGRGDQPLAPPPPNPGPGDGGGITSDTLPVAERPATADAEESDSQGNIENPELPPPPPASTPADNQPGGEDQPRPVERDGQNRRDRRGGGDQTALDIQGVDAAFAQVGRT